MPSHCPESNDPSPSPISMYPSPHPSQSPAPIQPSKRPTKSDTSLYQYIVSYNGTQEYNSMKRNISDLNLDIWTMSHLARVDIDFYSNQYKSYFRAREECEVTF